MSTHWLLLDPMSTPLETSELFAASAGVESEWLAREALSARR